MKSTLLFLCAAACVMSASAQSYSDEMNKAIADVVNNCTSYATVTASEVNMRKSPSVGAPSLGFVTYGDPEEDGCWEPELMWSDSRPAKGKWNNHKAWQGQTMLVSDKAQGWVQCVYDKDRKVWISDKYVKLSPFAELPELRSFGGDNAQWTDSSFGAVGNQACLYSVVDEVAGESSIYIGVMLDKSHALMAFRADASFMHDEEIKDSSLRIEKNDSWLNIYYGPQQSTDPPYGPVALYRVPFPEVEKLMEHCKFVERPLLIFGAGESFIVANM